jgi:glycerol-3-phosphate acyltransferase PlsY
VWLGFKGGKGVATSLGVLLTLYWPVALASLATWLVVAAISRISSLSALVAALAAPLYMFLWGQKTFAVATLIVALLVLIAHRENIKRLLAGTEPRIGKSK